MLSLTVAGLVLIAGAGCGTTRMTNTTRSATEQLLVSQSIDNAVSQIDFSVMKDKAVFFEEKCLDTAVDKGYLASSIRQQLLAAGCQLVEEKTKATYVVEARAGCVGTDNVSFLVGVPQMQLPTVMPGTPPMIPELPLVKSTDQRGVAKIAVFAYNRQTGRAVWQSGSEESVSKAKDAFVLGVGPFHTGTVQTEPTLKQLDVIGVTEGGNEPDTGVGGLPHATQAAAYQETKNSAIVNATGTEPAKKDDATAKATTKTDSLPATAKVTTNTDSVTATGKGLQTISQTPTTSQAPAAKNAAIIPVSATQSATQPGATQPTQPSTTQQATTPTAPQTPTK
jgi:hypothetical protein